MTKIFATLVLMNFAFGNVLLGAVCTLAVCGFAGAAVIDLIAEQDTDDDDTDE